MAKNKKTKFITKDILKSSLGTDCRTSVDLDVRYSERRERNG